MSISHVCLDSHQAIRSHISRLGQVARYGCPKTVISASCSGSKDSSVGSSLTGALVVVVAVVVVVAAVVVVVGAVVVGAVVVGAVVVGAVVVVVELGFELICGSAVIKFSDKDCDSDNKPSTSETAKLPTLKPANERSGVEDSSSARLVDSGGRLP